MVNYIGWNVRSVDDLEIIEVLIHTYEVNVPKTYDSTYIKISGIGNQYEGNSESCGERNLKDYGTSIVVQHLKLPCFQHSISVNVPGKATGKGSSFWSPCHPHGRLRCSYWLWPWSRQRWIVSSIWKMSLSLCLLSSVTEKATLQNFWNQNITSMNFLKNLMHVSNCWNWRKRWIGVMLATYFFLDDDNVLNFEHAKIY